MTSYASRCKVIAGICVRRTLPPHALLASLLLLGGLLLMRPAYFEADMVKSFAEVLCPCAGLLLLTPLFLPERDNATLDVLAVRPTPMGLVYSVRALCALVCMAVIPALFLLCLHLLHNEVQPGLWGSVCSSSFFLGALGAFSFSLWENIAFAYMVPLLYDLFCILTGPWKMEELGIEALSILSIQDARPHPALLLLGAALLTAAVLLRVKRRA